MILGLFLLSMVVSLLAQDIVFPGAEIGELKNRNASKTRHCPPNMMYVPEEDACECETGFLYYGPTDGCYAPYQRGPCPPGEHLVLPRGSEIAKCLANPCGNNGTVPFENTCIHLLTPGPPCTGGQAAVVDEATYELSCRSVGAILYQIITAPVRGCRRGSRRIASGKCRAIL
ncbi:uncharacterized protein LOC107043302 [Diachasma alloeum]|uniref:uncharacterized protein LOC107043302 n=1 Tax=Diachasma alloeum TaxID=454923 RepID=UPI0007382750|nr:uncharacterized protein LOC107043302 [Diachasma alloeum]